MNANYGFRNRRGIALIMALVAMAVITMVVGVMAAQIAAQRGMVKQRHRQHQAEWLARAGVELAAARLLESPAAFVEEKQNIAPDSRLRIAVEKAGADSFKVTCDAQVGLDEHRVVARTVIRRFRRFDTEGTIRLETIAAEIMPR